MTIDSKLSSFNFSEVRICRAYMTPVIQVAGCGDSTFEIAERRSLTSSRIMFNGNAVKRRCGILIRCSTTDSAIGEVIYAI